MGVGVVAGLELGAVQPSGRREGREGKGRGRDTLLLQPYQPVFLG